MINEDNTLQIIQNQILPLGYKAQFIEEFNELPFKVLLVYPYEEDEKPELKDWALNFTVFPMGDDLDGSVFLQMYWEYNLKVSSDNRSKVAEKLIDINFQLPLGSLGISPETGSIYFRMVMPIALQTEITSAYMSDVLDMGIYPMETFFPELSALL